MSINLHGLNVESGQGRREPPETAEPRELVVISGKGGSGKTSIAASFALLAEGAAVIADCDVDAADLHLVLEPQVGRIHDFISGHEAEIRTELCQGCGHCQALCRFEAIICSPADDGRVRYSVDPLACEGCGVCAHFCPAGAIDLHESLCGTWMRSETRAGAMIHAHLRAGAENSGKLVAKVRQEARQLARQRKLGLILTDGPPGIGCPVIAAVTGASSILIVTEPTISGAHDLRRVLKLLRHFQLPAMVCINKWDLNPSLSRDIEAIAISSGVTYAGSVSYDPHISQSLCQGRVALESGSRIAAEIKQIWERVLSEVLTEPGKQ